LLHAGACTEIQNASGRTALIFAAHNNGVEAVDALIEARADVNAVENSGRSALVFAAMDGNVAIAASLLKAGAHTDEIDDEDATPLVVAAANGRPFIMQLLIAAGASITEDDATLALQAAGNFSLRMIRDQTGRDWHPVVVKLLNHGADIDTMDEMYYTPLMNAVHAGETNIVETLIQCGADVDAWGPHEGSVLFDALKARNPAFTSMLLHAGTCPHVRDKDGNSTLTCAVARDRQDFIMQLLAAGVSMQDGDSV
jgi:ankyrin repeat protein